MSALAVVVLGVAFRVVRGGVPHDVILVSIDTLRADHLGCYGYRRPTTPHIDRFRRDAVLFSEAIAHSSSTLVSHASIMTSLLPQQHGASHGEKIALAEQWPTLAEILRRQGFRTVSFNEGGLIAAEFGIGHGFEVYHSSTRYVFSDVVDQAIGWMRGQPSARPLFLFLHTYEVHHPYRPPPADLAVMETGYAGPLPAGGTEMDVLTAINDGRLRIDGRDLAHIVATYDGDIHAMDRAFGRLTAFLEEQGRYEHALIVFTSDHGEEFAEHGKVGWHSHTLYDELLRVPLLIKFPHAARAGETVAAQVRGIDIAPTVLAALGIPAPGTFRGADLMPLVLGRPEAPRLVVSRRDASTSTSIRSRRWKLYDGRLLDLAADSGEKVDVAAAHPRIAAALAQQLAALAAEDPAAGRGPWVELSAEAQARLRALGYVR
ncbi:MAG TPA: sulfatase [Thermoanaerobaculia bacterium]|nr:sulfatase [Thermoanaerobaculia bacterium]